MSYVSSYHHCVFSTKERRPLITPGLQERLWPYLGGIAREHKMTAVEIGGVADHVHMLLSLPSSMPIAKALQLIKGGSSKWVHDTFPEHRLFGWQVKYGSFSVSVSQLDKIIEYIRNQAEHHKKVSFKEEFIALLRKHRIQYDEHTFGSEVSRPFGTLGPLDPLNPTLKGWAIIVPPFGRAASRRGLR